MFVLLALTTLVGGLLPHGGPPLNFRFLIESETVLLQVTGEARVWDRWLGLGEVFEEELPDGARTTILELANQCFAKHGNVVINGTEVQPVACEAKWWLAFGAGLGAPGLEIQLEYPYGEVTCDTLRFDWDQFAEIDGRGDYFETIPAGFKDGTVFTYGYLRTWEPSYTWHAGMEKDRIDFVPPPPTVPPTPWRLPLASFALAAVGAFGLIYLRVIKASGLVAAVFVLFTAGGAWALRSTSVYAWVPPGERTIQLPDDEAAMAVFERLHTNIYAAFSAESESDIYDMLAQSVDPELTDELYREIYSSLVLQDEGGARCEIERVEPYDSAISSRDPENATFSVDYAWHVYGSVFHFGHGHKRINQYRARYYVRHDGTAWRICAVDPRTHRRIGDDGELETIYAEEPEELENDDELRIGVDASEDDE